MSDWNTQIIEEFRANDGKVGGPFEGANMVLLHHVGRTSGDEYVAPVVFFTPDQLGDAADDSTMYVVASAAGAPRNPQWYANMTTAGRATVEVGTSTVDVVVEDVSGDERDRIFAQIVAVSPGFGDYATKTEGIRTIPVLALHRA